MRSLFKKKAAPKREEKAADRNEGILKGRKDVEATDVMVTSAPKGDFLETDEDLGYC